MAEARQPGSEVRRALACVALFLGGWWLVALRMEPPRARGSDAPAAAFSAVRALERWRALPGSSVPHPVGSAAHAELCAGIVESLRALGCEPELQEAIVLHEGGACKVRNVLARIPGAQHDGALLVCAHYDSVPAGPGAGDDGAGAASVLEIARALKSGAPLGRDVILLVDDGEELGLFGARAFCEQHAWARDVDFVVNLEARGTSGPCFLFETSEENAALITLAARVLPRPAAWSASYEVYRRMPNDTDLTVFKQQGWQGYNLAFVRGLRHYHTARDEARSLSADSVQQMGENALALLRGIGEGRLDREASGRAVYADFLGIVLLHWNQRSNLLVATGLALAIAFALWTRRRAGRWRMQAVVGCAGTALLGLVSCALVGWGLQALALLGREGDWPSAAQPLWMRTAIGAGVLGTWFALSSARWNARATLEERWAGTALFLALFALGLALGLPAASYLAILPLILTLLGFSLHELARERKPQGKPWMMALPAFAMTAGVAGPMLIALEWVFEFRVSAALGLLAGLVFLPLWVMAAEAPRAARALALAGLVVALGSCLGARGSPEWSAEHPAPLSLQHYQEAAGGEASWYFETFAAGLPEGLAPGFARSERGALGRVRADRSTFRRPAERFEGQPAALAHEDGSPARLRLLSHAGARMLVLRLPEGARPLALESSAGRASFPEGTARSLVLTGFGSEPLALEWQRAEGADRQGQVELFEIDALRKSAASEWLDKRTPEFVPFGQGDVEIVRSALGL